MSSKKFTAQTFAWLRLLKSDRDLTALAVGMQMIEHFSEKDGGRAWAGTAFMAKKLGLSQPTVVRAVHRMHARGRLRVEWGTQGRGHVNQYWMVIKDAPADLFDIVKDAPAHVSDPPKDVPAAAAIDAPASGKDALAHMNHLRNHCGAATTAPQRGRESSSLVLAAIPAGALAPVGGAPEESKALIEDRFTELLAIWNRPWGEDDEEIARHAFAVASREADPGAIIASAERWAAAVESRYLKPLTKWLGKGLWKRPPPPARPRRNGGKVPMSNLALEIGIQYSQRGR